MSYCWYTTGWSASHLGEQLVKMVDYEYELFLYVLLYRIVSHPRSDKRTVYFVKPDWDGLKTEYDIKGFLCDANMKIISGFMSVGTSDYIGIRLNQQLVIDTDSHFS